MNRMRQRIAARLKDAQNTAAMLTTFNEVDMRLIHVYEIKFFKMFLNQCITIVKFSSSSVARLKKTRMCFSCMM